MKKAKQPEMIRVLNSKKRTLYIDYDYNACDLVISVNNDFGSISLNELEAKRLCNALSRFIEFRKHLRDNF